MSISLPGHAEEGDPINSEINTTPLVDIMLVLLIIFLVTIPVLIKSVPITLPVANNIVTITKPENVVLAVDKEGTIYWNDTPLDSGEELFNRLKEVAVIVPQPEIHVRGDKDVRFESIGRVIYQLQRASILKVGFITNPEMPKF